MHKYIFPHRISKTKQMSFQHLLLPPAHWHARESGWLVFALYRHLSPLASGHFLACWYFGIVFDFTVFFTLFSTGESHWRTSLREARKTPREFIEHQAPSILFMIFQGWRFLACLEGLSRYLSQDFHRRGSIQVDFHLSFSSLTCIWLVSAFLVSTCLTQVWLVFDLSQGLSYTSRHF